MPIPVIPDFTVKPAPALADVRAAELAIVQVVGGVHEMTRYPGAIAADNFDFAAKPYAHGQVLEPQSRLVLPTGRMSLANADPAALPPNEDHVRCVLIAPVRLDVDTIVVWHNHPGLLTGLIEVRRNNIKVADLVLPAAGFSQGDMVDLPFFYSLAAGDVFDLIYSNPGLTDHMKTVAGAAPPTYLELNAQIWGVTSHVA